MIMEKDKLLADLFGDYEPTLSDDAQFMAALKRRLDAVEHLKQIQQAQLRRYRYAMAAVLAMALVAGGGLFMVISQWPADVPVFRFESNWQVLVFIEQHGRLIVQILAAMLTGYATIAIGNAIQNWQEAPRRESHR